MVFMSSELGEHSITTRDIDVNENTVVQFEVGLCTTDVMQVVVRNVISYCVIPVLD